MSRSPPNQAGSRILLEGVPPGEYSLGVAAQGYRIHVSRPFLFDGHQTLDLGRIGLDPCGQLNLEVKDDEGNPVDSFTLYRDGLKQPNARRKILSSGKYRYFELPIGLVFFEVKAEGYRREEFTLHLDPGEPADKQITLRPE